MTNTPALATDETKAAHTPGPWIVHHDGNYPTVRKVIRAGHHSPVCGPIHGYMYSAEERGEQAANARLIAAAPCLLDALEKARNTLAGCGMANIAADICDAAIAKARGQ